MMPQQQRGFVLATTLWIIAIVALVIGYFSEQVNTSLTLAQQKQDLAEQQLSFAATRSQLLFRLATLPMSFYGLGPDATSAVKLDDSAYRGSGSDVVQLQDERGLININFPNLAMLGCFLNNRGIPYAGQTQLIDTLQDYTDEDDFRRLNGAEAADYRAQHLPPPPNDLLYTPYQLKNVIGWRSQVNFWKGEPVIKNLSASRITGFNPNTAPAELLACLPGGSPEHAKELIRQRNISPLYNENQLSAVTGAAMNPDDFLFFPGYSIRVTQTGITASRMEQYVVTLTPLSDFAPWRIDYFFKSTVASPVTNAENLKRLPTYAVAAPQLDSSL